MKVQLRKFTNKILNSLFEFEINLIYILLKLTIRRKKVIKCKKSILALPYISKYGTGGHSRIGDWKSYFNDDDIGFEVHWASDLREFEEESHSNNPFVRYWFFQKVLWRRVSILFTAYRYDTVFVQRAIVPFYPFKKAYFERILSLIDNCFVIDFYDADYVSNYQLTVDGAIYADKVTVASPYLENFFLNFNRNTLYVPFAIDYEVYRLKEYIDNQQVITIGWMGSVENFSFVLEIKDILKRISDEFLNVKFIFICSQKFDLYLKNCEFRRWGDPGFDYYKTVASFDIGIVPLLGQSETTLAKTAFKSLEFMSSGIAFVCSPIGIPNYLEHEKNAMIAIEKEDWYSHIKKLILEFNLRKSIGYEARLTMTEHYSYLKVYRLLKSILCSGTDISS